MRRRATRPTHLSNTYIVPHSRIHATILPSFCRNLFAEAPSRRSPSNRPGPWIRTRTRCNVHASGARFGQVEGENRVWLRIDPEAVPHTNIGARFRGLSVNRGPSGRVRPGYATRSRTDAMSNGRASPSRRFAGTLVAEGVARVQRACPRPATAVPVAVARRSSRERATAVPVHWPCNGRARAGCARSPEPGGRGRGRGRGAEEPRRRGGEMPRRRAGAPCMVVRSHPHGARQPPHECRASHPPDREHSHMVLASHPLRACKRAREPKSSSPGGDVTPGPRYARWHPP